MINVELSTISLEVASCPSSLQHDEAEPNQFFSLPTSILSSNENAEKYVCNTQENQDSTSSRQTSSTLISAVCSLQAGVQLGVTEGLSNSSLEGNPRPPCQPISVTSNVPKPQGIKQRSLCQQIWKHLKVHVEIKQA